MGDVRYDAHYRRVLQASDRAEALRLLADDEVVQALAAASRAHDALLANVLATEAMNRMRRSRVITENLADCAFAVDPHCRLIFVNPALGRRSGMPWMDALGRDYFEVMMPLDATGRALPVEACPVRRAMTTRAATEWNGPVRVASGDTFYAQVTVAPVLREGDVEGAVGAVRDVTEHRSVFARFESLFHEMPTPTFFLDPSGTLTDANPAGAKLMRVEVDALRGEHFSRFIAPEQLEVAAERFARVLEGERRVDDYTIVRPDGSRVLLRITGIPMHDGTGVIGLHGFGEVLEELGNGE